MAEEMRRTAKEWSLQRESVIWEERSEKAVRVICPCWQVWRHAGLVMETSGQYRRGRRGLEVRLKWCRSASEACPHRLHASHCFELSGRHSESARCRCPEMDETRETRWLPSVHSTDAATT